MSDMHKGEQPIRVTALSVTAVKATRLRRVQSISLSAGGARGDRAFFLIDRGGRMINGKVHGGLQAVVADWDEGAQRLSLSFPDRAPAEGVVVVGRPMTTRFYSNPAACSIVEGPWAEALSSYLGEPVRLVRAAPSADRTSWVDRGFEGAVSLISRESLARLAAEARVDQIDGRRFRMLVEVDGLRAHQEDTWIGRTVRIGDAAVRFSGNVGRCLITTRDPETGESNLPTLDAIRGYRKGVETTEPLPFGIYGEVVREGNVRVGDQIKAA
jgi:MOSC domain-containing protein